MPSAADRELLRVRQLYRITPDGRVLLRALRREVTELYREVVLGDDPDRDPRERPRR